MMCQKVMKGPCEGYLEGEAVAETTVSLDTVIWVLRVSLVVAESPVVGGSGSGTSW